MIRFIRDLRLIPIVLIASACLLALKLADLALDSSRPVAADDASADDAVTEVVHTMPDVPRTTLAQLSWAQQMFNFSSAGGPASAGGAALVATGSIAPPRAGNGNRMASGANNGDITGSVTINRGKNGAAPTKRSAAEAATAGRRDKDAKNATNAKNAKNPKNARRSMDVKLASGTVLASNGILLPSGSERAILERLRQRRQDLDARAHQLDIREGLIAVAEKRMESRLAELKDVEARIAAETKKKNEIEFARFKALVTMYENMKARDAAKIFDHLEPGVLIEVASQINPRRMSDILAQMSPDVAERLTVELAGRARTVDKVGANLPKIEGSPTTP